MLIQLFHFYSFVSIQGLLRGDKFLRIGTIDSTNHESLRAVATEVQANENASTIYVLVNYRRMKWSNHSTFTQRTVTIEILRVQEGSVEETKISLVLTPKSGTGRGLLGCHIIPI